MRGVAAVSVGHGKGPFPFAQAMTTTKNLMFLFVENPEKQLFPLNIVFERISFRNFL